jgi:hypothetical protein
MYQRIRRPRTWCALAFAAIAALALAACGSSSGSGSGDAKTLLDQTFSGTHTVNSGTLNVSLTFTPTGSSTLKSPISISFGGPFQSLGKGKLPKSNFNISLSSGGQTAALSLLSTGTAGYITLQGTSYQMPAATFQKLESGFSQFASSPGGTTTGSGTLSKLGIHPLDWLSDPSVVGSESMGGADTTHIRATVNVASLLTDVNTFLGKASSIGVSGASQLPSSLSADTRTKIASEVQSPTFDVWTGKDDKTVRKLALQMSVPVTGQISTQLGGLSSAGLALTMQYGDINEPQTITAPTSVRPYSEFTAKLQSFVQALQGSLGGSSSSSGSGTATAPSASGTTSTTPATGSGTSAAVQRYSQCILKAGNDVSKMQQCASLINSK